MIHGKNVCSEKMTNVWFFVHWPVPKKRRVSRNSLAYLYWLKEKVVLFSLNIIPRHILGNIQIAIRDIFKSKIFLLLLNLQKCISFMACMIPYLYKSYDFITINNTILLLSGQYTLPNIRLTIILT